MSSPVLLLVDFFAYAPKLTAKANQVSKQMRDLAMPLHFCTGSCTVWHVSVGQTLCRLQMEGKKEKTSSYRLLRSSKLASLVHCGALHCNTSWPECGTGRHSVTQSLTGCSTCHWYFICLKLLGRLAHYHQQQQQQQRAAKKKEVF